VTSQDTATRANSSSSSRWQRRRSSLKLYFGREGLKETEDEMECGAQKHYRNGNKEEQLDNTCKRKDKHNIRYACFLVHRYV